MAVELVEINYLVGTGTIESERVIISADNYKEALEYLVEALNADTIDTDNQLLAIKEYPDDKKRKQ